MNWTNIKRWAKDHGYTSLRDKTTDPNNPNDYDYYWAKSDNPSVTGVAISVSSLAKDIYNHLTDDKHIEHQLTYKKEIKNDKIQDNYGIR